MKRLLSLLLLLLVTFFIYSDTIIHIVERGDTLFGLSLKYEVPTNIIKIENGLESDNLYIGQKINITKLKPDRYKVLPGDSLSSIAYNHDITLKHLLLVNRIADDYSLKIGETLIVPTTPEKKREYIVKKGDTLSWISMTYNIDIEKIKRLNKIQDGSLVVGQELKLISSDKPEKIVKQAAVSLNLIDNEEVLKDKGLKYIIKAGDTLSAIALEYQTSVSDISSLNNLNSTNIKIGDTIYLPSYAKKREPIDYNIYHIVEKGDTLSQIALDYNISETLLREINHLDSDKIKIGDSIKLIPQESRTYRVLKGDTLWSIAQKHDISVDQLMQYNHLNSTLVPEGKLLTLYDYSVVTHTQEEDNFSLVSFKYKHNTTLSQPYKSYSIDQLKNPLDKYNKAKENWKNFSKLISNEEQMSNDLEGWTVILDPGHGGKDPGAIATVTLNGKKRYIVEDEYAYDTAVRLYELLKRNGADVYMTILSPDHIARNPSDNATTFINEKNEVYNDYKLNSYNNSTVWPVGGQWGLEQRVKITNNILSVSKNKKTIFISIHADNDVDRDVGKLVLYSERNSIEDQKSKDFANYLLPSLGDNATADGMTLAVLHNNNADVKVLIELRNMAHLKEAMALLDNNKRQEDALMILNGIKNYTKKH
ncbi:LysM peptidoglycan-binding domain-containing protein [Thiospirochaeta perfilievii]|uniref:LysM peptidoglycan-binding domain-containing protein n=1 Tax=Thiospirochaeta perfilievii TaxID=252967 RepID=A0A5C1QG21_9SPIO|nr:LysM peptidoglycan-binding domain-containing protein [Thiospirochaeta perfilievii]QEN06090.1 LysM peptidoglycan-binding domain-containing protein [Thiospirochaeta perfilievii]